MTGFLKKTKMAEVVKSLGDVIKTVVNEMLLWDRC